MSTVWPSGQLITTSLKDLKRLFPELYAELVTGKQSREGFACTAYAC